MSAARRPRQEPGLACQECRKKKLRCDRKVPCGGCIDSGVPCQITEDRPSRGPKKGYLRELRSRIVALERRLHDADDEFNVESVNPDLEDESIIGDGDLDGQESSPLAEVKTAGSNPSASQRFLDIKGPESLGATSGPVPALTRADLDQLYFDRVHVFTPILQQSRYFSWAKRPWPSGSHMCLRYAVWMLAASLSSQFESMRSALYRDTRQMLERLELEDGSLEESYCLQRAQAWILVAVYEFMHTTFQRAWTSAGRAFRLAQLMKLNEIDSVNNLASQSLTGRDDFIELEEKRRTFWKAYCLDRFFCFLGDLPLTVNEHTIFTRLPSQETDFELGKPVLMPFLSEVMVANDSIALSPFAECIILSTIWSRIQAHQQQCLMEQAYGIPMVEFWDRHLQLENFVTQRIKLYQTNSTLISVHTDPDRLFTNLIAQAAVLSLCKVTESMTALDSLEYTDNNIIDQYKQRSLAAAQEIARLSKSLCQLSFFKIHPFTSIALFVGCEYLIAHKGEDASSKLDGGHLHDIIEALQELKNVNLLCQAQLSFWGHEISNELLD